MGVGKEGETGVVEARMAGDEVGGGFMRWEDKAQGRVERCRMVWAAASLEGSR
jgi:hypothetical protein